VEFVSELLITHKRETNMILLDFHINKNLKSDMDAFHLATHSQHKYRSIFITWIPRKTEWCLCRLVLLNGKHQMSFLEK